jgi:hypothetical protein
MPKFIKITSASKTTYTINTNQIVYLRPTSQDESSEGGKTFIKLSDGTSLYSMSSIENIFIEITSTE